MNGNSSEPAFCEARRGTGAPSAGSGQALARDAGTDGHMVQAAMREGELGHEFPVRSKGQPLRRRIRSAMDAAAAAAAKATCKVAPWS